MNTNIKDYSDLPLTLTVEEVGKVLGIGRPKAYELANREDFPKLRLGKRIIIPKNAFIKWMDTQSGLFQQ